MPVIQSFQDDEEAYRKRKEDEELKARERKLRKEKDLRDRPNIKTTPRKRSTEPVPSTSTEVVEVPDDDDDNFVAITPEGSDDECMVVGANKVGLSQLSDRQKIKAFDQWLAREEKARERVALKIKQEEMEVEAGLSTQTGGNQVRPDSSASPGQSVNTPPASRDPESGVSPLPPQ